MKKTFFTLAFLICGLCSTHATWIPSGFNRVVHSSMVNDITHDDSYLYVARGNGLVVIEKATGQAQYYNVSHDDTSASAVNSLALHGNTLYMAGSMGLATYCNGKVEISSRPSGIEEFLIVAIGSDGKPYTASYAFLYKENADDLLAFAEVITRRMFDDHIIDMVIDSKDNIWVSNYGWDHGGLSRYSSEDGIKDFWNDSMGVPPVGVGGAFALAIDSEGTPWVSWGTSVYGNQSKLTRLCGDSLDEFVYYDAPAMFTDMKFDAQGRLWAVGECGTLYCFQDGYFTSYPCDIADGYWFSLDIDGDVIYVGTEDKLLKFKDGQYEEMMLSATPTQIETIQDYTSDPFLYDLQGRRLHNPGKGIYIQDGHKVVR